MSDAAKELRKLARWAYDNSVRVRYPAAGAFRKVMVEARRRAKKLEEKRG